MTVHQPPRPTATRPGSPPPGTEIAEQPPTAPLPDQPTPPSTGRAPEHDSGGQAALISEARRAALCAARAETVAAVPQLVLALHPFAPGRIVLALGGEFDRPALERLDGLLRSLRGVATTELLVDLGAVRRYHPRLARVLDRARIHRLIDGTHLELLHLPAELDEPPERAGTGAVAGESS